MKKILLILSCFIAGTCGIERSFANPVISEALTEGETLSNQAQNNLINNVNGLTLNQSNSNLPVNLYPALHRPFEDFLLNNANPFASPIIEFYKNKIVENNTDPKTILLLITSQTKDFLKVKSSSTDVKNFISTQVTNYLIAEAIKCAAQGALFNLKSPAQLSENSSRGSDYIFAESDTNEWNAIGQTLCNILKYNSLTNFRLQEMNKDERYAYNQFLGFLVWNIGLKDVEKQYQAAFTKAIENKKNDLARAILVQIRNAYYWAMLRNPAKADSLVECYNNFYIKGKFYQKFSMFYLIKPIKAVEDLSELQSLFTNLTLKIDNLGALLPISTPLGNKFDIASKAEQSNLGSKCTASPQGSECYAISGLVPLLAKGLVSAPRLELNIMDSKSLRDVSDKDVTTTTERNTNVHNSQYGSLLQSYTIAYSHLGYMPLEIRQEAGNNMIDIIASNVFPFLPIYFSTLSVYGGNGSHYEMLCRSICETLIKEAVGTIKNKEITNKTLDLVRKRQPQKLQFIELLQKYQPPQSPQSAKNLQSIQQQVDKLADDSYFKATDKNSIDPLLSIFSQRTDDFAYRK